jgi:hypothetical protein
LGAKAQGAKAVGSSSTELAATITADIARWGKVIRDAHIEVQQ